MTPAAINTADLFNCNRIDLSGFKLLVKLFVRLVKVVAVEVYFGVAVAIHAPSHRKV